MNIDYRYIPFETMVNNRLSRCSLRTPSLSIKFHSFSWINRCIAKHATPLSFSLETSEAFCQRPNSLLRNIRPAKIWKPRRKALFPRVLGLLQPKTNRAPAPQISRDGSWRAKSSARWSRTIILYQLIQSVEPNFRSL